MHKKVFITLPPFRLAHVALGELLHLSRPGG